MEKNGHLTDTERVANGQFFRMQVTHSELGIALTILKARRT